MGHRCFVRCELIGGTAQRYEALCTEGEDVKNRTFTDPLCRDDPHPKSVKYECTILNLK